MAGVRRTTLGVDAAPYGLSIKKLRKEDGFLKGAIDFALKPKSRGTPPSETVVLREDPLLVSLDVEDWPWAEFGTAFRVLNKLDVPREDSDAHEAAIKYFCGGGGGKGGGSGGGGASSGGASGAALAPSTLGTQGPPPLPSWFAMSLSPETALVGSRVLSEKPKATLSVFGVGGEWLDEDQFPSMWRWAWGIAVEKTASTITIKQLTCVPTGVGFPEGWRRATLPAYENEYFNAYCSGKPAEYVSWSGAASTANATFAASYLLDTALSKFAPQSPGSEPDPLTENGLTMRMDFGGGKAVTRSFYDTIELWLPSFPRNGDAYDRKKTMSEDKLKEGRLEYEQQVERARSLARVWTEVTMPY